MKKHSYIAFFLTLFCCQALWATHNRAGEISFEALGQFTYRATIHTYTKASSRPADRDSLEICWGDGTCEWVLRTNGDGLTLPNDIKYNQYIIQHTYADFGEYRISMTDPNRTGGNLNLNPPSSDNIPFHIESRLVVGVETNNSPQLLMPPIDRGFVGLPFSHTPNAFDIDDDSLAYELTVPLQASNVEVPNYSFPNQVRPGPMNNISIDPITGEFQWVSPAEPGEYTVAILIKEYRNGILIGSVLRDLMITVELSESPPPGFQGPNPPSVFQAGDILEVDFEARGFDTLRSRFSATGGAFILDDSPATFSTTGSFQQGTITANLRWAITDAHERQQPYQFAVKAEDQAGGFSLFVFQISIDNSNSVPELSTLGQVQIYPNPAKDQLWLDWNRIPLQNALLIRIYDLQGQLVLEQSTTATSAQLDVSQLPSGPYLLTLNSGTFSLSQQWIKG
ncbi:MAG: T9SS type A sorting domain-containing protein [Bacteroidota bacterium]